MFDDLDSKIAELRAQIAAAEDDTGPSRRGWWIYGAGKMLDKYVQAKIARDARDHRFIVHEPTSHASYAVCACGARFRGTLHEDFTVEQFPYLPGHLPWEERGTN